jgi:hypothetical protein
MDAREMLENLRDALVEAPVKREVNVNSIGYDVLFLSASLRERRIDAIREVLAEVDRLREDSQNDYKALWEAEEARAEKAEAEVERSHKAILALTGEVERLRAIEDAHVSCADWPRERTLKAEAEVARLRKERDRYNRTCGALTASVRTLEEALTEAHRMLQGAWALLPPEDGERLGIKALMVNCERPECAALRESNVVTEGSTTYVRSLHPRGGR